MLVLPPPDAATHRPITPARHTSSGSPPTEVPMRNLSVMDMDFGARYGMPGAEANGSPWTSRRTAHDRRSIIGCGRDPLGGRAERGCKEAGAPVIRSGGGSR